MMSWGTLVYREKRIHILYAWENKSVIITRTFSNVQSHSCVHEELKVVNLETGRQTDSQEIELTDS